MSELRQQIHTHYQAQSLPAEKVDAILAGGRAAARGEGASPAKTEKVVTFPRPKRFALIVAAAVLLFVGLAIWQPRVTRPVSFALFAPRVVEFFGQPPELPKRSQNPEELRTWLLAQGAPTDFQIPAKLRGMESLGCQVVNVHGRPAYLTCFWREKGELVHLLVARRDDFREAPSNSTPQFRELSGWSFASWSEGETIYTLATAAPLEKLRPFVWAPRQPIPVLAWL
jgi:hypothetical protein